MKTLGILGGMSWASTLEYYKLANEQVNFELGGHHSAKILLFSVDFSEIYECQKKDDWIRAGKILSEAALKLEKAGASLIVLATNTMHKVAEDIAGKLNIPFLHIADCLGKALQDAGLTHVGLLGTKYTMEMDFYQKHLLKFGITCLTPDVLERETLHKIIFEELVFNKVTPESIDFGRVLAKSLKSRGAQAIALACTELRMFMPAEETELPIYDTTFQHVSAAVQKCLMEDIFGPHRPR